jgi:methyltransferase (TIGR00027 family)
VNASDAERFDEDNSDPVSGVGATATIVAAARAMATRDSRGLINDPFAEHLVRAVGIDLFVRMVDHGLDLPAVETVSPARVRALIDGVVVRTKYFDDYLAEATDTGVRQVVILAAGLDARAYRLPWPTGTVIYEVDQPRVIEFKTTTLAELGAEPTATRHTVAADLRGDWSAALCATGFDPDRPTAWLAEGLLIYLTGEAQDRLFDNITALSEPGSTVATEYAPGIKGFNTDRVAELSSRFRAHGVNIDMPSLIHTGERSHVADYLRGKGWTVRSMARTDLFTRSGLVVPPAQDDSFGEIYYISGILTRRHDPRGTGRPAPETADSGPASPPPKRGWARRLARWRPTAPPR